MFTRAKPTTLLIVLCFALLSCSKYRSHQIKGVWYSLDFTGVEQYFEAHVTDTGFFVVNQGGPEYLASYAYEHDTLTQYLRDFFSNRKIIDTLKFHIEFDHDSLKMINIKNPKANSNWTRIPNVEPFEFYENRSVDTFATALRQRYFHNYVSKFVPENYKPYMMDYFDLDWGLNRHRRN